MSKTYKILAWIIVACAVIGTFVYLLSARNSEGGANALVAVGICVGGIMLAVSLFAVSAILQNQEDEITLLKMIAKYDEKK